MSVYYIYMLYIHFMIRNVHLIYTQCTPHNISLFLWQMTIIAHVHTHMEFKYQRKNNKFRSFFFSFLEHTFEANYQENSYARTHTALFIFLLFQFKLNQTEKLQTKKQFKEFFNLIFHTCTEAKNDDDVVLIVEKILLILQWKFVVCICVWVCVVWKLLSLTHCTAVCNKKKQSIFWMWWYFAPPYSRQYKCV